MLKHQPQNYISLAGLLFLGALFVFLFQSNKILTFAFVVTMAIIYTTWSIYHHYKKGDLHKTIVIEYVFFALLVVLVFATTLFF